MSLTWSLIGGFLYAEIAIVLFLVLPVFSASRWNRFFKSKFLSALSRQAQIYFYLILGVLVIFLLEAIREMQKYGNMEEESTLNLGMQHQMRLFRAQRNFYISGFAVFLSLVIRRLIILISQQATLIAQSEASMKQAKSASDAARSFLSDKKTDGGDESKGILEEKVKELEAELKKEMKDKEALKSQAESINREYDRLTDEFSKLQNKMTLSSGDKSD